MTARVVLDASVGVKWIRDEKGTAQALELLRAHGEGGIEIVVASLFCYEYLAVARRFGSLDQVRAAWRIIRESEITVIDIEETLVVEAIEQCEALGCTFYDAMAPALAGLLNAPLYSADHRAHGKVAGAVLLG